jgi:hypothetical protein
MGLHVKVFVFFYFKVICMPYFTSISEFQDGTNSDLVNYVQGEVMIQYTIPAFVWTDRGNNGNISQYNQSPDKDLNRRYPERSEIITSRGLILLIA